MVSLEEFVDGGDAFGEVLYSILGEVGMPEFDEFSNLLGLGEFGDGDEHDLLRSSSDSAGGVGDSSSDLEVALFEGCGIVHERRSPAIII